jgi:cell division protein FtsL
MALVKTNNGILSGQRIRVRRDPRDMGFFYISLLVAFLAVAVVGAYLTARLHVVGLGYEISALSTRRAEEQERNKRIRVELSEAKSPARIEKIAVEELGLDYPESRQVVRLR